MNRGCSLIILTDDDGLLADVKVIRKKIKIERADNGMR